MKSVLILCTGNSCRSQMAQVLWQHLGQGKWQAQSAGSRPAGYVHPMAIAVLKEAGLETTGLDSKSVSEFSKDTFDLAVTVCDHARENCPVLPGVKQTLHWPFEDPAYASGSDEEKLGCFRKVRDQIRDSIEAYFSEQSEAKSENQRDEPMDDS